MTMERAVRAWAGTIILVSLALATVVSPSWIYLTTFVGVMLLQSAFTGFCPAEMILGKVGVGKGGSCCAK